LISDRKIDSCLVPSFVLRAVHVLDVGGVGTVNGVGVSIVIVVSAHLSYCGPLTHDDCIH